MRKRNCFDRLGFFRLKWGLIRVKELDEKFLGKIREKKWRNLRERRFFAFEVDFGFGSWFWLMDKRWREEKRSGRICRNKGFLGHVNFEKEKRYYGHFMLIYNFQICKSVFKMRFFTFLTEWQLLPVLLLDSKLL